MKTPKYPGLDHAILRWCHQQAALNIPIQGADIQAKAEKFSQDLGVVGFKSSLGWLRKFKLRHGLNIGKNCVEARDVDERKTGWLSTEWPKISRRYGADDIFNADETCLFFKLMPDKTLKFKNEKCMNGEFSKERLTVLVCANLSGSEKRKLLVIGKSTNPRCFKNVKFLPVTYQANKSAWITGELFLQELCLWNEELRKTNRNILLIVDNCPAHPASTFTNIKLKVFPPNMIQPMELVIPSLKCHYRKLMLLKLLEKVGMLQKWTVLDAVTLLDKAWSSISRERIVHCFRKAGLSNTRDGEKDNDDDIPLSDWFKNFETDCSFPPADIDDLVDADKGVVTCAAATDCHIINEVLATNGDRDSDEGEPPITLKEALAAARMCSKFAEQSGALEIINSAHLVEKKIETLFWESKKIKIK